MHRFQAIAHVGQCAAHDHAHRIIEIALAHLVFDIDANDFFGEFCHQSASLEVKKGLIAHILRGAQACSGQPVKGSTNGYKLTVFKSSKSMTYKDVLACLKSTPRAMQKFNAAATAEPAAAATAGQRCSHANASSSTA